MKARAAVLVISVGLWPVAGRAQPSPSPPRPFLRDVIQLTEAQIRALESGQVVTKQLPSEDKGEMAAFAAVFVNADKETFLARLRNLAEFRRAPSVLQIGRLSSPPRVEDLAGLTPEDSDLEAIRRCQPGSCDVKMARSAMAGIGREVDWSLPDARSRATTVLRQMLVDYAAAYMKGGTAEMATNLDKQKPVDTSAEFRKVLAASPYLVEYVPAFHRYVEDYPRAHLEGVEDLFYWSKDKFGPKPSIALFHVSLWNTADRAVIASKQIYASHYFEAGLELAALVDAPGRPGFYLLDVYRARIDPPTGMLAGVILGKIRGGIETGLAEGLRAAKAKTEAR